MDTHYYLIGGSALIVVSYVFDLLAKLIRVPSVLMILGLGVVLHYAAAYFGLEAPELAGPLQILGTVGLILIVLEGSLDLKLGREQIPLIRRSLASAFFVLVLTSLAVAFLFKIWLHVSFLTALVNGIPLGVISSAIAVPSVVNLHRNQRDFIVYESTFSDILGIMMFNFFAFTPNVSAHSALRLGGDLLLMSIISVVACFLLLFFLEKITHHIKFILLLAVLVLAYALGELVHLSTLLLILVFGLFMNNTGLFIRGFLTRWFSPDRMKNELDMLKGVTAELAFLIRTFFFLIFGFSIHLEGLLDREVWLLGSLIIAGILIVRYIYLKTWLGSRMFPELFIAPRGLITILLFYGIPAPLRIAEFSQGILFFVIVLSTVLMAFALIMSKKKEMITEVLTET